MSVVVLVALSAAVAYDTSVSVHVRGQATPVEGVALPSGRGGLNLQVGSTTRTIPWMDIASLDSQAGIDEDLVALWQAGQDVHRAMRRVERGDLSGAEPLFAEHFRSGPDDVRALDLACADGLMRCRIDRGAMAQAVVPMLQAARALRRGASTGWIPIVDEQTAWCPWIAPAWLDEDAAARCGVVLDQWDAGGDPVLEAARADWLAVARGQPVSGDRASITGLTARAIWGDATTRQEAVEALTDAVELDEDQTRAWRDWAVGCALLQDAGQGRRREALSTLARIPALYGDAHPYLAGMAAAVMACELTRDGRLEAAESLRQELQTRWPGHPVLQSTHEPCLSSSRHEHVPTGKEPS